MGSHASKRRGAFRMNVSKTIPSEIAEIMPLNTSGSFKIPTTWYFVCGLLRKSICKDRAGIRTKSSFWLTDKVKHSKPEFVTVKYLDSLAETLTSHQNILPQKSFTLTVTPASASTEKEPSKSL